MNSANRRYPSSRWRSALGGGKAQSWPPGEKSSGGEPTLAPATKNSRWPHRSGPKRAGASAPSRPPGGETAGRRAPSGAGDEDLAVAPQVGAETVRGERQVVIDSDGTAAVACFLLRPAQLDVDLPLDVLAQHHGAPAALAKGAGFGRCRVLVGRRPLRPDPHLRVAFVQGFVQRRVGGEFLEQLTFAGQDRKIVIKGKDAD